MALTSAQNESEEARHEVDKSTGANMNEQERTEHQDKSWGQLYLSR